MRVMNRFADPRRPAVQRWARLLMLCLTFTALHGVLGAWVVSALAGERPVVQLCTAQGVQWVVLAVEDPGSEHQPSADGSIKPCVGAGALVALASPPPVGPLHAVPEFQALDAPRIEEGAPPGRVQRVLLMSSMRGPPAPPLRGL